MAALMPSLAGQLLWSASATRAALPPWMTWKLVTIWPLLSQTKPVPVPRGSCCTLRLKKSRSVVSVVMCTTDGDRRLKSSMLASSSAPSAGHGQDQGGGQLQQPAAASGRGRAARGGDA